MPRQARTKSKTGIYHIMLRGINQQQIFEDGDNLKFTSILEPSPVRSHYSSKNNLGVDTYRKNAKYIADFYPNKTYDFLSLLRH